ncbi:MAG: hypothetical protein LBR07_07710 [Puniceicoccales bacterium]|jgi:hypothetical protein|nr:hypothetical protein [Puniceicoccales bacterium]
MSAKITLRSAALLAVSMFSATVPAAGGDAPKDAAAAAPTVATPAAGAAATPAASASAASTTAAAAAPLNDASLRALSREEVRALARIIRFKPAQLASLRQSLEALEKMTPAEKQELLRKLEGMRGTGGPPPQGGRGQRRAGNGGGPSGGGGPGGPGGGGVGGPAGGFPRPEGFGGGPPPSPRNHPIFRYWRSLPPERAREEQEKFQKMSIAERRAYAREVFRKLPRPPRPEHAPEGPKPPARQPSPDGASGD